MSFLKLSISLSVLLASCSYSEKDFNLSAQERNFLNPFRKGDSIYYQSSSNKTDTIIILGFDTSQKKEKSWLMAKPAFNEIGVSIQCLPAEKWDHGKIHDSSTKHIDTEHTDLITISKFPQTQQVNYSFSFRDFFWYDIPAKLGILHKDTLSINGVKLTNYYTVKYADSVTGINDIETLFWTESSGLVAYKCHNGDQYVRKDTTLVWR